MEKQNYFPPQNGGVLFVDYTQETSAQSIKDKILHKLAPRTSFISSSGWLNRDTVVFAENGLFYLGLADNGWSFAIILSPKEEKSGLAAHHKECYMNLIQDILLDLYGEVGQYSSAYTHKTIRRDHTK